MSDLDKEILKDENKIEEAATEAVEKVAETVAEPVVEPVVEKVAEAAAPVAEATPVVEPVVPVTPVVPVVPVTPEPSAAPVQAAPVAPNPADLKKQQKAEQKAAKQAAKKEAKKQKKMEKLSALQDKIDACPREYKPVSTSKYFWFGVLSFLPVIGLLFTLITSIVPRNRNVKNFERAILVYYIIGIILALIAAIVFGFFFPDIAGDLALAGEYFLSDILAAFGL